MKRQIQRRFILFSMLTMSIVIGVIIAIACIDRIDRFFTHKTIIAIVIVMGMIFVASFLLSKIATKPIERAWQRQLDFTADASHELRTPLAVFRSNLEIIRENPDATIKSQEKWLNNLEVESLRMQKLVEELLILSRADTNSQMMKFEEIPLDIIIMERIESFNAQAMKQGVSFKYDLEENLIMNGDSVAISKLFSILIDNSLKYMGREGIIFISAKRVSRNIEICYRDDGVGVEKAHREHLFERFYRVDKARSRNIGGSGLGLAIAQSVVNEHGGSIQIEDIEDGLSYRIKFGVNGLAR